MFLLWKVLLVFQNLKSQLSTSQLTTTLFWGKNFQGRKFSNYTYTISFLACLTVLKFCLQSKDPIFNKALSDAKEIQKNSQNTYLEDFFVAFDAIKGETRLASPDIFANRDSLLKYVGCLLEKR